jgi:hypothetical protein
LRNKTSQYAAGKVDEALTNAGYTSGYDHKIYCLPRIQYASDYSGGEQSQGFQTNNFYAWASFPGSRSVYHSTEGLVSNCLFPSFLIHEIGHNIRFTHFGVYGGGEYSDQSGMMGFSYSNRNGPVFCFNGAKNWEIGWYDNRKLFIDITGSFTGSVYQLISINDYQSSLASGRYVSLKFVDSGNSYYLSYSRRVGIQSGLQGTYDQRVILHRAPFKRTNGANNNGLETRILSNMGVGNEYTFSNFNNLGGDLVVQFQSKSNNDQVANVRIAFSGCSQDSDCVGFSAKSCEVVGCNTAVTPGQCEVTDDSSCPPPKLVVSVTPDNYPSETSWVI